VSGARELRDREAIARDLIGIAGLTALALGLVALRTSEQVGFDPEAALRGMVGELPITLPAAALVLAVSALELGTGLVLARSVRRRPFDSAAEAAIAAFVAAVLKDAFVLGLLGGVGLFRAPVLVAIDVAILAAAWRGPVAAAVRPVTAFGEWRRGAIGLGSLPLAALVAVVWLGPVLLQLASPAVPFIDVLPNYVGPAEHLRTFGWLSPLTTTVSPIHGPSRSVLGYEGLLGSLATISGLPAVLAISAFILPSTLLVAAAVQRAATALAGPGRRVGPWALLAFAVTESFARLGDVRGTVIVLPLVAFAFALAADGLRGAADDWRPGRGLAIGAGLGAAVLLHPVIGAFAIASLAILALVRPEQTAADALVAGLTAGLIALPQLGVMVGAAEPPLVLALDLVVAMTVSVTAASLVARRPGAGRGIVTLARWARLAVVAAIVVGAAVAATGAIEPDRLPDALGYGWNLLVAACGVLLLGLVLGWLVGSPAARSPLLAAAALVGVVAAVGTQLLPSGMGFLGDALRFEIPKTVHYWLPVVVALAAGPALAAAWTTDRGPWLARVAAVAGIVVIAAFPLRTEPIDAFHLGEHRYAESLAIDLRWAGSGFWAGFPDSREIIDPPRREIADVVRAEIDAGRIRHDTPVLHVARSFQQWVSTPLGVFDGVVETFVSLDREVSQQTVGGRLHDMVELDRLIASGAYPYVVLEPAGLADGDAIRARILAAGYRSIFANDQGEVFVRAEARA